MTSRSLMHELVMMLLSLVAITVVMVLLFVDLTVNQQASLILFDYIICTIFIAHFSLEMLRSDDKLAYFKGHWLELLASIPLIEPLRMMRLLQILRVIRILRHSRNITILLQRSHWASPFNLVISLLLILFLSSVLVLFFESGVDGSNITSVEDSIWWALVTISTVGYGDSYPVTGEGRLLAAVVIICGVSFFGVLSGYMASLFVSPNEKEAHSQSQAVFKQEFDAAVQEFRANQRIMQQNQQEMRQAQQQMLHNQQALLVQIERLNQVLQQRK